VTTSPGSRAQTFLPEDRAARPLSSFDELGIRYDESRSLPPDLLADVLRALSSRAHARASPVALDCGCGTGLFLPALADAGWDVVGVDVAQRVLRRARTRVGQPHVTCASGVSLPFRDNSFGVVVVAHVLEHVRAWRDLIAECRRVVCAGGAIGLFSTPGFVRNGPRSRFKALVNERGEPLERSGPSATSAVTAELDRTGALWTRVTNPSWGWTREQPVLRSLEFLKRRDYSIFWNIPAPLYNDVLSEVEHEFGPRLSEVERIQADMSFICIRGERTDPM